MSDYIVNPFEKVLSVRIYLPADTYNFLGGTSEKNHPVYYIHTLVNIHNYFSPPPTSKAPWGSLMGSFNIELFGVSYEIHQNIDIVFDHVVKV